VLPNLAVLKSLSAPSPGGPVGLFFATLGYSVAVLVARAFVFIEARCVQFCPVVRVSGFRMHHLYYGLALILLSTTILAFAEDVRTKWDGALVVGIGLGLIADEVGLLILKVSYWDPASLLVVVGVALSLGVAALTTSLRKGFDDFHILSRYDLLTSFAVLLGLTGFLFFDRPLRLFVEVAALGSWALALFLFSTAGKTHLLRIRKGQLDPTL
jgi:divalent metal cation (Fe/Co/Zn/Cd) transporter